MSQKAKVLSLSDLASAWPSEGSEGETTNIQQASTLPEMLSRFHWTAVQTQ
jgi:hypothetical protein